MSMNSLSRHIRLMARGEMLVIQAKLSHAMRRTVLGVLGLVFGGMGLVFLNIGLFAYLSPIWGSVGTPVGLGLINMIFALVAILAALFLRPGADLALAEEIRTLAGEAFETDIRAQPLMGALSGTGRSAMAGLLLPAITTIISAMGRGKKKAETP